MGRGGYFGGSTIIYPGGRGWSYDPLSPMPGTKKKKSKKKSKKAKSAPKTENFLDHFSLSCACCELLKISWPEIGEDKRRIPLSEVKNNGYHKPFRNKVRHQKKQANRILASYVAQCVAADKKGESRPRVPKSIRYAAEVEDFGSKIEAKITGQKNALAKLILTDRCDGPLGLPTQKKRGLKNRTSGSDERNEEC